ncbi:MAG: hypothetical protein Q8K36_01080, partial [Alphaproteobacteria bacterium]|nr:hypothetical protein [Alphaproteobacteria bacterium]
MNFKHAVLFTTLSYSFAATETSSGSATVAHDPAHVVSATCTQTREKAVSNYQRFIEKFAFYDPTQMGSLDKLLSIPDLGSTIDLNKIIENAHRAGPRAIQRFI